MSELEQAKLKRLEEILARTTELRGQMDAYKSMLEFIDKAMDAALKEADQLRDEVNSLT